MEIQVHGKRFQTFISSDAIAKRIVALGAVMTTDYKDMSPMFIAVLNGAYVFAADLLRHIDTELSLSFVRLQSYSGETSSGAITTVLGLPQSMKGRHVIVLEDIIDTGTTLNQFLPLLHLEEPASIKVAAFLIKQDTLQHTTSQADYFGFEVPNTFIIGYGLDYDGLGRNLPDLYRPI